MSVGARTQAPGSPTAGEADGGQGGASRESSAGMLLRRLTVLPALVAMSWLVVGLPLLMLGWFNPTAMLLVSIPVTAVVVYCGLRWMPSRWQDTQAFGKPDLRPTPWWSVLAVIGVALAFGVDQMIFHSQFVIVTRDPGSYAQFAAWIAHHGSLPIPQDNAAFGGVTNKLTFASPAFFQVGLNIVPQFMAGLPMVLAGGFWVGGANAAVAMAPILGACAILTFGGLVARLAGPRSAPLAALVLALALPMEFTSRSTYSEPLAAILFLGGLCLVIDSLNAEGRGIRVLAGLAGLALGLTFLVRLDGASDILPVIPYCGLLYVTRRPQTWPMIIGFVVGIGYGVVDGRVLTWPYLQANKSSVEPLAVILLVLIVATVVAAVALRRRQQLPQIRWSWLPNACAALAVLVIVGFAVRPYLQVVRGPSTASFQATIVGAQLAAGQPIDPSRLYYELSLHWVFWYIGVPAVILGTAGAAILIRRSLRASIPAWTLPLLVFSWAIVTTIYRPAITPDQPWASRRLVPAVLPGFILLAVWAVRWLSGWLRERGVGRTIRGTVLACCVVALVLPATITTFNLGVRTGGPVGVRLTADGVGVKTTYSGEIAAVNRLCAALPKNASVVIISYGSTKIGNQITEVVRGMCGVPTAVIANMKPATMQHVIRRIYRAGRQPVLLANVEEQLTPFGGTPRHVVHLHTMVDEGLLTTAPTTTRPFSVNIWISEPPP